MTDVLTSETQRLVTLEGGAHLIAGAFLEGRIAQFEADEAGLWVDAADWLGEPLVKGLNGPPLALGEPGR